MTITERNQKLDQLREKLTSLRNEQCYVEQQIQQTLREYNDKVMFSDTTLYDELFEDML